MWVLFAPDAGTVSLWQTLEENEFFELQAYKPATAAKNETSLLSMLTALPSSLLATSRAPSLIGGGTEETFPYRILLKEQPPYGLRQAAKQGKESRDSGAMEALLASVDSSSGSRSPAQVIALAKDLRAIKEHWNWLVNDMSTACSFFTRESEKEENELWDFLLVKFTSMAQQEAKKREMQRERERERAVERERQLEIASFVDNKPKYVKKQANIMITEEDEEDNRAKEKRFEEMDVGRQALWKKLFPKISTIERLIVEYPCSLERKGVERRGLLLVTPRHVCFHSPRLNTRVAIYWRVITSLSRATAVNGTVPAIYVTCLGAYHEEFLFHSLADFEQTMSVLVRIWHMALLEEAADRDGDEDAKARLMSVTREQILCEIEREKYRKSFRMPKDELLIAEFCGSLWMENVIQVYEGTLHLSANYVCFYADVEGHSFSVVIPFREVLDIISVDSKLIQVNTHSNKFSFSLLWRRQHCCELMVQLWSRRVRSAERLLEKVPPAEGPWEDFNFVGLGPIAKDHKHFRSDYAIKQKLQRRRWEEYIAKYGWGIQMLKASDVLRDIVHFGIPDELKGGLWQIFLGSIHSLCIKPGEYHNLLKQFDGKNSDAVSEIERDVNRSLPEHPYFQSEKGKQALRNVLTAYSWRNPSLGYCQSMNIICSLLLLFMGEEEAFWALTILCEELFPHYFTPDMLGSMTDQHVLEDLVAEHFPKLNAHLESIQLPLVLISFPWFMCLFIGYIPMQTSIRILDILFCEGFDSTFIFKVALAVFKFNQKFILNTRDFSKLVIQLKFTNLDCDTLLEITEDFWWVTSKLINEMRDYHRFQLLKESKTPVPPINASPGGSGSTPLSARSTSAPTHFPRAPSTPVQTPTPTPSSSPPLPAYMTMPIRTRSDSSLFATGTKSPLGMSLPDGGTGSLTTIPFLPSADSVVASTSGLAAGNGSLPSGGGQSGLLMSAPAGYHVAKTPSPSATPRKVQFDGTTIPFVGVASNDKIISALTRLSSKEHLTRRDEDSSTDATTEDDSSSDIDESSDSSTSSDDDDDSGIDESDTISSSEVSESEARTRATSVTDEAGSDKASSPGQEADEGRGSSGRRRKPRRDQEGEREQLFHLELETAKPDADAAKQPQTQQITPRSSNDDLLKGGSPRTPDVGGLAGAVVAAAAGAAAADGSATPPSEGSRTAISKSEPSTPLRTAHSDDVLASSTIDPDKEKRRKRKLKSRRRRLASLGRTRSRKSRERIGRVKSGRTGEGSEDLFEPDPEADEREKRIVRLDLDLNLAWRKSPDDRAAVASGGADGANKGVKYLQRFLFKKRRRHSDGYLDIIKEDESLASPRGRTGDDPEPLTTHRRFFVEEDEGEERETTAGELEAPDSARREKGKEKETSGNVERRRSQTDAVFSPRYGQRPSDDALLRVTSASSPPVPANLTPRGGSSSTSSSSSSSTSSSTSEGAGLQRPAVQRQQQPQQQSDSHDGERKDQSPPPSQQQQNQGKGKEKDEETDDDSSSETDESERDDELKSSVFVTSTTTVHPRVRKTKKVRERRASVANLLRKEPSGRLLDHVERKRTDQLLEDEFLMRAAGASAAAAAGKRSDELASIASSKSQHDPQAQNQAPFQTNTPAATVAAAVMPTAALTPVKATPTPTPGGRSPPAGLVNHKLLDELREDTASSADEDSGSDLDPAGGREHGASPEGGRRKKIRSKLRHSRRLSISDPNLATSPPTRIGHRSRSNSKSGVAAAGGQAVVHPQSTSDDGGAAPGGATRSADDDEEQEEWERASSDGSERRGHRRQRSNSSNTSSSDDDDDSRTGGGSDGEGGSSMSANGGNGSESGGSRRRAKAILFKYSADILAKTKAAEQRRREERRDKDRTREEEKEKRKRERLDEKEARRRSKEEHKERRRLVAVSAPEREKEDESAEKKRRHKEEKELKRRKEEEEKESRRKRKEEEKEMKKLHKLEKKASSSSTTSLHSAALGGGATVEFAIDEREGSEKDREREKHKKAFGLLPLPHLSHHHSLSFHLPSSPRRGAVIASPPTTASSSTTSTTPPIPATSSSSSLYSSSTTTPSSSSSSSLLKTPPSPRAHVAPITFNRTTPHPHAVSADPPPESPRKLPFASVGGVAASDVPLVASRTRLQTSDRSSP